MAQGFLKQEAMTMAAARIGTGTSVTVPRCGRKTKPRGEPGVPVCGFMKTLEQPCSTFFLLSSSVRLADVAAPGRAFAKLPGRRHQLRSHFSFSGYPVVSDQFYTSEEVFQRPDLATNQANISKRWS